MESFKQVLEKCFWADTVEALGLYVPFLGWFERDTCPETFGSPKIKTTPISDRWQGFRRASKIVKWKELPRYSDADFDRKMDEYSADDGPVMQKGTKINGYGHLAVCLCE